MRHILKAVQQLPGVLRGMHQGFLWSLIFAILLLLFLIYTLSLFLPPRDFPVDQKVVVSFGNTLLETTALLEEEKVVRSSLALRIVLMSTLRSEKVQAGSYHFPEKLSLFEVAHAIAYGEYGSPPVTLTIHEGLRSDQIAEIVKEQIPDIDVDIFLRLAKRKEGYLFPDTYHVPEDYTARELVRLLETTFDEKVGPLEETIQNSPYTFEEVIIFASILEKEARSQESMRTVAGILQNRLSIDMPLQVDAAFEYFLGKSSADLTLGDLKIESPYNTYLNTGLPPTPIANPGLQSIEAVLDPIETPYFYYLTGNDGNFYYAKTFEEHKRNKELYL